MMRDNQAVMFIANNQTFPIRTKHIEIECHVIHHRIVIGIISTPYVASAYQLVDIVTKALAVAILRHLLVQAWPIRYLCSHLKGSVRREGPCGAY